MSPRSIVRASRAAMAIAVVATTATAAVVLAPPMALAATLTFTPAADGYVQNTTPSTNFGTASQIIVDNSPVRRTFLRFTVSGLTEPVTNAKLRIHVDDISNGGSPNGGTLRSITNSTWSTDPVLVGAGDIASCSSTGDEATATLLDGVPGTVFTAGDNAYENGSDADYTNCYNPSWGRHKARTKPSAGNHEYNTAGASGYFTYFGAAAGDPSKGYYSYNLGT